MSGGLGGDSEEGGGRQATWETAGMGASGRELLGTAPSPVPWPQTHKEPVTMTPMQNLLEGFGR